MGRPESLLAIDPGKKSLGYAWFINGLLFECGLMRAKSVESFLADLADHFRLDDAHTVVIEVPQVYDKRKTNPNDLMLLPLASGVVLGALREWHELKLPHPREWKGQTPKEVCHRRIKKLLDTNEAGVLASTKAPKSLMHNVLDAVGIGLWGLGRM